MKPSAIVYESNTGFTARYAKMLGAATGLPVYRLSDNSLPKDTAVIFCSWLIAGRIRRYRRAFRRYNLRAVCAVGLCGTGMLLQEVRRAVRIPEQIPLFTLQGGMDHGGLKGIYRSMIQTLIKMLSKKKNPSDEEREILQMIRQGGDFVREENLSAVLEWWETPC